MQLRENLADWSRTPFESSYHMQAAIRDPQYSRIPEYRAAVEAKICRDAKGVQTAVYNDTGYEKSDSGIGQTNTEAGQVRVQEHKTAEQLHAEIYGPLSVPPAPRQLSARDLEADAWNRRQQAGNTEQVRDDER